MPVFEKAKNATVELLGRIMKKYHPELHEAGVLVDVIMALPTTNSQGESTGPPLKKNGYPCAAIVKIVSLADRVAGLGDAMLKIDADEWKAMTDGQQAALIDHELTHLQLKRDGDGVAKTDDLGRPKLQIKRHDVEIGWFSDVVRRHERDALEYQAFDTLTRSVAQMQLPFMQMVG
jgi:hypothetical protein